MRASRFVIYIPIWLLAVFNSAPAAAINILMVTTNNGSLTSTEAGRKSYWESQGYTVNTIWDNASQATFNTAFANNRAIYVGDEVTSSDLGYKLREATIGVLSEHTSLVDEFGFCTSSTTTTSSATISIVNNTHYITNVFSTGALSLGSSTYNVNRMGGTTASGAVVLATVGGSNSAVAVETGATLANTYNGSNVAFGRRVQFPLPVSINDGSSFGANTYTLADRMLAWAAGLDRTIVAHWRLNETSGTSAADSSGFNRTGTVTGTATWTPAVRNNGFSFNGSTRIQATGLLGSHANLTVAAWANLTTADTSGAEIVSLGDHFYIRLDESGWARAYMYNGSTWLSVGVNQTFAGTGWHHFAAVFDDDNDVFKFYVDGALAASTANTSSISYAGLGANTVIGRHGNSGTNHDFTGIIDEVRVYNYVLSDTEIATLYGFIGHWKLSETSGTTAADSTIFARNGTVNGGAAWSPRCNGDRGFEFNGSSHYISIPDATHLRPTESLTIAAWIRGDAWTSSDIVNPILRKGESNPNNYQLAIRSNGRIALSLDANDPAPIQGNTVLTLGQWYHVAATWDGSTVRFYLDGQPDGTAARSGTIGTDTRPLYIGGRSGTDFFDGMIYDVRFYNRALSQADIAKLAGFVGHWRFAEGSGTSAADSTPLANNATLSGGASWTSDCANNALLTNGAGAKAQTAAQFTPPSVGTVAFWMRGAGAPATPSPILGISDDWEVRQDTSGVVSFDLGGSPSGGSEPFSTVSSVAEAGQWYHLAAVYSDVDNSYAVYVDGQLRTSGVSPVDLVPQTAGNLSFGTRTGSANYWNGALRDVRGYSRRLCPSEIAQLSGFVGHWALDETSGTNAADASLLANHATYTNNPTLNVNGPVGRAVHFNGTNYAITNQIFNPPATGTVTLWMRRNGPSGGRERLFGVGGDWEIWQDPDGLIRCDLGGDGRVGGFESVTSMNSYQWYHIAAAFDDVSNTYKLYINGVLEVSGSMGMVPQAANQLTIAGRTGLAIERFHGDLDDLRIYSRILCPTEIQSAYNGGEPFDGVKIIKWVEIQ